MKLYLVCAALLTGIFAAEAGASDSLAVGVRGGAALNHSSYNYEAFGDLYINRLISIGADVQYVVDEGKVQRDSSMPITVQAKLHIPLVPLISPYLGVGQALVFHEHRATKGTQMLVAGIDWNLRPTPLFLNLQYRRQIDDRLDFIAGGVGVKF